MTWAWNEIFYFNSLRQSDTYKVDNKAAAKAKSSAAMLFSAANLALVGFPLTKTLGENLPSRL